MPPHPSTEDLLWRVVLFKDVGILDQLHVVREDRVDVVHADTTCCASPYQAFPSFTRFMSSANRGLSHSGFPESTLCLVCREDPVGTLSGYKTERKEGVLTRKNCCQTYPRLLVLLYSQHGNYYYH